MCAYLYVLEFPRTTQKSCPQHSCNFSAREYSINTSFLDVCECLTLLYDAVGHYKIRHKIPRIEKMRIIACKFVYKQM